MSVDIEYPLPGDTMGLTFRAGGDYDLLKAAMEKKDAPPDPPKDPIKILNLFPLSKVRCMVFDSNDHPVWMAEDDLSNAPDAGTWEALIEIPTTTVFQNPCRLQATFFIANAQGALSENDNETTANLTIVPTAQADPIVIGLP